MTTGRAALPCGCVVLTDDSPVIINGVDMGGFVVNICGVQRCPAHQAEWDAGVKAMADRIDQQVYVRVCRSFGLQPADLEGA